MCPRRKAGSGLLVRYACSSRSQQAARPIRSAATPPRSFRLPSASNSSLRTSPGRAYCRRRGGKRRARRLHAVRLRRRRAHHFIRHQPEAAGRRGERIYPHRRFRRSPGGSGREQRRTCRQSKEFIAYAKANPGRLNTARLPPGSLANLAFMLFQREAGIALQSVAYRGASHAMTDLMGRHISVTCTALTSAAGTIQAGKARALAVTARERVPDFLSTSRHSSSRDIRPRRRIVVCPLRAARTSRRISSGR